MNKVIDLNWCMARFEELPASLFIISPSGSDEGLYIPAQSVRIYGKNGIIALRDALNEIYPPEDKVRISRNEVCQAQPVIPAPVSDVPDSTAWVDTLRSEGRDEDGWIKWEGGDRPVPGHYLVTARLRNGEELTKDAEIFDWKSLDAPSDIIAYKVHKL